MLSGAAGRIKNPVAAIYMRSVVRALLAAAAAPDKQLTIPETAVEVTVSRYLQNYLKAAEYAMRSKNGLISLKQFIALDILTAARRPEAAAIIKKAMAVQIPVSYRQFIRLPYPWRSYDFLIYRAMHGSINALKLLAGRRITLVGHADYYKNRPALEKFDIVYPIIVTCRNPELLAKIVAGNGGIRGAYALRWAHRQTLDKLLTGYGGLLPYQVRAYLIIGTGNRAAAKKWLRPAEAALLDGGPLMLSRESATP
jgi:hypothetical protein